ncbi:MAG: hypothetical protein JSU72_03700 [Deltaproteobacteria bacterium]|nr:MAG: hypothetical protein JSU72_03700 [Deltaproteobacteria bacterium]
MSRLTDAYNKVIMLEVMFRGVCRGYDYHEAEFISMVKASFWDGLASVIETIRDDLTSALDDLAKQKALEWRQKHLDTDGKSHLRAVEHCRKKLEELDEKDGPDQAET